MRVKLMLGAPDPNRSTMADKSIWQPRKEQEKAMTLVLRERVGEKLWMSEDSLVRLRLDQSWLISQHLSTLLV